MIRHQIHRNRVQAMLISPSGGVTRDMLRRGLRVQFLAKTYCPVDFGRLRSSITLRLWPNARVTVGTNVEYALWVHDGTGIYGPRGAVIRPVRARYLSWVDKRTKQRVFARQVRGMPGRPFLRRALVAARG